jgi:hypothetical protein
VGRARSDPRWRVYAVWVGWVSLVTAGLLGLWAVAHAGSAVAATTSVTFSSTGAEQAFTVPAGVSVLQVLAVGGRAGTAS